MNRICDSRRYTLHTTNHCKMRNTSYIRVIMIKNGACAKRQAPSFCFLKKKMELIRIYALSSIDTQKKKSLKNQGLFTGGSDLTRTDDTPGMNRML